jgi:hypothetical protein
LKLPRCIFIVAERKQSGAVIFFEEWNWKSCLEALQFRTPFERFIIFKSSYRKKKLRYNKFG